jgi:hypothetical protein
MARPENQKNLNVDIPATLHQELVDWVSAHKNVKLRQSVQAMVELWLSLPEAIQAVLLVLPRESVIFRHTVEAMAGDLLPHVRPDPGTRRQKRGVSGEASSDADTLVKDIVDGASADAEALRRSRGRKSAGRPKAAG